MALACDPKAVRDMNALHRSFANNRGKVVQRVERRPPATVGAAGYLESLFRVAFFDFLPVVGSVFTLVGGGMQKKPDVRLL